MLVTTFAHPERPSRHVLAPVVPRDTAWVDSAKGIGILLVVLGHTWRGCAQAGLFETLPPALFQTIDASIYAFHMPLFFMISGLFLIQSLERRGVRNFTQSRIAQLLWPMVLWSLIFSATKLAAGSWVNTPLSLGDVLRLPVPAMWQFWFLWALFLIHMGLILLRPFLIHSQTQQTTLWLLLLGSLALIYIGTPPHLIYWTNGALNYVPALTVGMLLGTSNILFGVSRPGAFFALAVFALMLLTVQQAPHHPLVAQALALVLCISLLAGLSRMQDVLPGLMASLALLGKASMAIYLAHTFFSAAIRIVLQNLGITALSLHILLGVALGVVMPLCLLWLVKRFGKPAYIGF